MIEIKAINSEYAKDVAEIEKLFFSHPWSEATLASEMEDNNSHFFGAFIEGELAGYIGGRTLFDESEIYNVGVNPKFRRKGAAKALIERFIEAARERDTQQIFLEVRPSNLPAINLYEKVGFVFCGLRKNYYSDPTENAILMRLAFDGTMEYEDDD